MINSIECSATSRDRRPRLSAHSPYFLIETLLCLRIDEGVCPYFEAFIPIKESTSSNSKSYFLYAISLPFRTETLCVPTG